MPLLQPLLGPHSEHLNSSLNSILYTRLLVVCFISVFAFFIVHCALLCTYMNQSFLFFFILLVFFVPPDGIEPPPSPCKRDTLPSYARGIFYPTLINEPFATAI